MPICLPKTAWLRLGTTVHSVVYNLTDCTALWVGNEHYGEEAYTFQLAMP